MNTLKHDYIIELENDEVCIQMVAQTFREAVEIVGNNKLAEVIFMPADEPDYKEVIWKPQVNLDVELFGRLLNTLETEMLINNNMELERQRKSLIGTMAKQLACELNLRG